MQKGGEELRGEDDLQVPRRRHLQLQLHVHQVERGERRQRVRRLRRLHRRRRELLRKRVERGKIDVWR